MKHRKQIFAIVSVFLVILISFLIWVCREIRQQTVDQTLIQALKAGDNKKAFAALANGANGEAHDTGGPPSLREALQNLKKHFRSSDVSPSEEEIAARLPPLLVLYHKYYRVNQREEWGPDPDLVKALLEHGAQARDLDEYYTSSLWYASCFSNSETVNLLLAKGADVNSSDSKGVTALMNAVIDERFAVARVLLEHGANVSVEEMHGQTALDLLRAYSDQYESPTAYRKMTGLLRKYGAK